MYVYINRCGATYTVSNITPVAKSLIITTVCVTNFALERRFVSLGSEAPAASPVTATWDDTDHFSLSLIHI